MKKLLTTEEIIGFIKNMPFNKSYAAIASAYEETEDKEPEGSGWWSIIKLAYAGAITLLFDYFGGGYPLAYCIDEINYEDTLKSAVTDFLSNNCDFYGTDKKYVVNTELTNVDET
ncbi:MAG: hypothetical protein K6C13_15545 [Oscillospiraceae bacterium]|nr:hypothetical protein [Oscillospiraceae bacterium]